jgi:hypothetical protein
MSDTIELAPPGDADQAFLRAARVWGRDVVPSFWGVFRSDRLTSLGWAWENASPEESDPAEARERLKREHAAMARPDLARVHVSWWVRALQDEPRSVRAAVVANLPPGVADALRDQLRLRPADLRPDRPADPLALRAALALWTVRLVGDLPDREDARPVVAALTRFDARVVVRLIRTAGLAKWTLTRSPLPCSEPQDRERSDVLRGLLAGLDPAFKAIAGRDVEALGAVWGPHPEARLGLTTVARLLSHEEPHRVRWVLQHLPYSTARAVRSLLVEPGRKTVMLARWERGMLRASWMLLQREGRITEPWRWEDRP